MSGSVLDAIAHPTIVNPLAAYGQALGINNQLNANWLFRAKQAAGQAYQQATDPTTGVVDPARAAALIAQNPDAALAAQENATSGQALTGAQQDQALQRSAYISSALGPVLRLPDAQLHQGVNEALQRAIADKIMTPAQATAAALGISNDPAVARQQLQAIQIRGQPPGLAQTSIYGAPTTINQGGQIIGATQSQQSGAVSPAGAGVPLAPGPQYVSYGAGVVPTAGGVPTGGPAIPTQLSPGEKASTQPALGPSGEAGSVPVGTKYDEFGNLRSPAAPAGKPGAPGFTPTALSPTAGASIEAFNKAQQDVPAAVNRVADMQKAYQALSLINSGPGTGTWQQIRSTIQSLPVINGIAKPPLGEEDSIANYDTARKYMQSIANRMSVGSTAQGLAAAEHANASTDISQGAGLDVLRTNIGAERMAMAQTRMATDPQSFNEHAAKFAENYDRRAFSADMYTPAQLKTLVAKMKPAELDRFKLSLSAARQFGAIPAPGQ